MSNINLTAENNTIQARIADSFLARFLGLMGRNPLPENQGLLLSPCSSIHMMFMRFPIDAVFLDKEYRIIRIVPNLRPWLGLAVCTAASSCLELPAGTVTRLGWQEGLQFTLSPIEV